jgi:TatD DNase family protein
MLIDTHAHLTFDVLRDVKDVVLAEAHAAGVGKMITIGIDRAEQARAIGYVDGVNHVWMALGFHPYEAETVTDADLALLDERLTHPRVVAVGEMGLDYLKGPADHDRQKAVFEAQLDLARTHDLPIVIHNREAIDDILAVLERRAPVRGVMHSFTGTADQAARVLDLGLTIGVNGIVTFSNAKELQAAVQTIPLDRLILETDCPFLAPHPYRGQTNAPKYIPVIADKVAELLGTTPEAVAKQTTQNAEVLFGI